MRCAFFLSPVELADMGLITWRVECDVEYSLMDTFSGGRFLCGWEVL